MAQVRIKVEAWLELADDTPLSLGHGGRVMKARDISLAELGRCIGEKLSTKDIKVRHLEAIHLVSEID